VALALHFLSSLPQACCRIGERSSHTWLVLKYLLGYLGVKNHDGSWTGWGNVVRAPIARAAV